MTLKSIELSSFKSFGKKSTVLFTTPITAVVGPNGSGKSNIVESIRFVLGEQSMKSLRGKGGVDLIYKGSKILPSASRASVSIVFDNSKKIFSFTNSGLGVSLDYDEVTIGREVFADGVNRYTINGTEVRLKDVNDVLASVNIGSSGHHIISQGEADRVLNASNKDRRAMIEDALGLKVYQFRIKESERKLDKTLINIKEVQSLRREIAPHLAFLKKQVEKIEKARELREELRTLYKTYFSVEAAYVAHETTRLAHIRRTTDETLVSLQERITHIEQSKSQPQTNTVHQAQLTDCESQIHALRSKKDEYTRTLGRIEGTLDSLHREIARVPQVKERVISHTQWQSLREAITNCITEGLTLQDAGSIHAVLHRMKEHVHSFDDEGTDTSFADKVALIQKECDELEITRHTLASNIHDCIEQEKEIQQTVHAIRQQEAQEKEASRDSERVLYDLLRQKNEAASTLHGLVFEEEKLALIKQSFEMELAEGSTLIGREVLDYMRLPVEQEVSRHVQEESRRRIERIKIKLEDAGTGNGGEVLKEYEDTVERDLFLAKEITDLNTSIDTLRTLILELKETLDREFKTGVEKINKQFQEFFALMFGGGSAFLSIVMEHKRPKKGEEIEESEDGEPESTELGFERGIEINVTLPQKKVKDLHMLSGGERSLTSIALLFAISQVNPPPFLVLDETDAALDEANSRRYGQMLETLSEYSQLIVVTHNRETMSRAQVLYGVTMEASGASKLLSIHLEDANMYAK